MQIKVVKVKAGQAKLREAIKDQLMRKVTRAWSLINRLNAGNKAIVLNPAELDEVANELRHLAYQIRALQQAKKATEEA